MLTVRTLTSTGALKVGDETQLGAPGVTWVDLEQPDAAVLGRLKERYGLHPLAVEDCLTLDQRPKLEAYAGHQFLVLQGFECPNHDLLHLELRELHAFIGPDWILTVHDGPQPAIAEVVKRLEADPANTLGRGPDFLAYLLADAMVDSHFPLLDRYSDEIESLEERIFERPKPALMQRAFALKRALVQLRRVLSPQRDVLGLLSRSGVAQVSEKTSVYFRDVYDHLMRLSEQIDSARDLLGNAMEAWLSVVANKTNDITKQLTLFASIFMPLSFVVGFFGQNFEGLAAPWLFWPTLGVLVALPVGMVGWFRYRRWL
ncbi:MAG: magnesium/cobalt transporter CorA [Myxococcaceae bacterium]|nr:magnesium/cobalt transporter CorA [Myxococcaceae bacterium]